MVNNMWIFNGLMAALFSGLTTFFAKISLDKDNSILITGIRTIVITIFTIICYLIFKTNNTIDIYTIIFIILSGISTAVLWIVYFKALSLQDISLVTPIDKLSIVITLILSYIFFKEKITIIKIISMIFILTGTFLMVNKSNKRDNNKWLLYAFLTALFTSLSTILGKIGLKNIDVYLATMLRTITVLIIIWFIIIYKKEFKKINKRNLLFVTLSGISTGLSWLFYFKALKEKDASIVFPLEKLSAAVCILLSVIFLKEKLNKKRVIGFIFIIIGTLVLIIK